MDTDSADSHLCIVVRIRLYVDRVYLEHLWVTVDGRSSLPVGAFDEAIAGFPERRRSVPSACARHCGRSPT